MIFKEHAEVYTVTIPRYNAHLCSADYLWFACINRSGLSFLLQCLWPRLFGAWTVTGCRILRNTA